MSSEKRIQLLSRIAVKSGRFTGPDARALMGYIREIIERENWQSQYQTANFYGHLSVHHRLEGSQHRALVDLNKVLFGVGAKDTNRLVKEMQKVFDFPRLRVEIMQILAACKLNGSFLADPSLWINYVGALCSEITNKYVSFPDDIVAGRAEKGRAKAQKNWDEVMAIPLGSLPEGTQIKGFRLVVDGLMNGKVEIHCVTVTEITIVTELVLPI